MEILFLRHAEAHPDATNDFSRALTPKGIKQSRRAGEFCARRELSPELIISSPVLRALQTAEIVAECCGTGKPVEESFLACGMTAEKLYAGLAPYSRFSRVMVTGHEPDFSTCILDLIGACPEFGGIHIRKASLTLISFQRLQSGAGELQFSIPVQLMSGG